MQNDVLKNEITPWQEKGRWYKMALKSNRTAFVADLANSDFSFIYSTSTHNIGGFHIKGETLTGFKNINDVKCVLKCNTVSGGGTSYQSIVQIYSTSTGFLSVNVNIPASLVDELIIYIHSEDAVE